MLQLGFILFTREENRWRFQTLYNYCKVNKITKPDSYPRYCMESVDWFVSAEFVSKFDLLKGCWQIPLTTRVREIVAFIISSGLFSNTHAIWFNKCATTFQRLMSRVVSGLVGCRLK